jgi:hypothetical protein
LPAAVSKRTDIERGRPVFRRPLRPTAAPGTPPVRIGGGYPEPKVQ